MEKIKSCADLTDQEAFATDAERKEVTDLMWAGDNDALYEKYSCSCCCDEHFSRRCSARIWGGCIAQDERYPLAGPQGW